MKLTESQLQLLAQLFEADRAGRSADPDQVDGSVLAGLSNHGLVHSDSAGPTLTDSGRRHGASAHHYQHFYPTAHASAAHSLFCERVYGRDLCQDGQTDMTCLHDVIDRLQMNAGSRALDIGCGAGGIAHFVSLRTGAHVTGIDNSAPAITIARQRASGDRTTFVQADMNVLDFPKAAFDAVLSIDSISWAADLPNMLVMLLTITKPHSRLCFVTEQRQRAEDPAGILDPDGTPLARALSAAGLRYELVDHTADLEDFWHRARHAAATLREDFARDGAEFICNAWLTYADDIYLPAIANGTIRRYLYHATV
jgi:SAM-dependent methyltransferase